LRRNKENILDKMPNAQLTVWRNGGSNPAEKAVQFWEFVPRRKRSGAATSPSRWDITCKRRKRSKSEVKTEKFLLYMQRFGKLCIYI